MVDWELIYIFLFLYVAVMHPEFNNVLFFDSVNVKARAGIWPPLNLTNDKVRDAESLSNLALGLYTDSVIHW